MFGFEILGFLDGPQWAYSFSNIGETIFCVPRGLWSLTRGTIYLKICNRLIGEITYRQVYAVVYDFIEEDKYWFCRVTREDAEDESVNNDPLPFDPKDATEPMEV
jgi:hypothetical protein